MVRITEGRIDDNKLLNRITFTLKPVGVTKARFRLWIFKQGLLLLRFITGLDIRPVGFDGE